MVLQSGLLTREQLEVSLRAVPKEQKQHAETVAEHLIRSGRLSRFQAQKLLQGTPRGLVLGPFQILAPLGRGAAGMVYLARDSRSQQLMAVKVLPPQHSREDDRRLSRFRREMLLSQRLAHPHIAYTYEIGVSDGVYYLAMEFIPGKSLHRLVAETGRLGHERAMRLFAEVASALDHAHARGLIHRDLKPSNIMVTPDDYAKVLDFGLALMPGEEEDFQIIGGRGYAVGTMDYIAPEQATDSSKADARSDLYSLGCTLYFALAGRPPFPGGDKKDKIRRHRTQQPDSLATLVTGLPEAVVQVVSKLMSKEPGERYETAIEVEEVFRSFLQSNGSVGRNGTALNRPTRATNGAKVPAGDLR